MRWQQLLLVFTLVLAAVGTNVASQTLVQPPHVIADIRSADITDSDAPRERRRIIISSPDTRRLSWSSSGCRRPDAVNLQSTSSDANGFNQRKDEIFSRSGIDCNSAQNMTIYLLSDPSYVCPQDGEKIEITIRPDAVVGTSIPWNESSADLSFFITRTPPLHSTIPQGTFSAAYIAGGIATVAAGWFGHPAMTTVIPRANFLYTLSSCSFIHQTRLDSLQYWLRIPVGTTTYKYFVGAALVNFITIFLVLAAHVILIVAWARFLHRVKGENQQLRTGFQHGTQGSFTEIPIANSDNNSPLLSPFSASPLASNPPSPRRRSTVNDSIVEVSSFTSTGALKTRLRKPAPTIGQVLDESNFPANYIFVLVLFAQVAARSVVTVVWNGESVASRVGTGLLMIPWLALAAILLYLMVSVFPVFWDSEEGRHKPLVERILIGIGKWTVVPPPPPEPPVDTRRPPSSTSSSSSSGDESSSSSSDNSGSSDSSEQSAAKELTDDERTAIKVKIREIFEQHAPEKIVKLDGIYEKYAGMEDEYLDALQRKYGVKDVAKPSPTPTVADRIRAMYECYAPEKAEAEKLNSTLQKYEGAEDELLSALVKKYGKEPDSVTTEKPVSSEPKTHAVVPSSSPTPIPIAVRIRAMYERYAPEKAEPEKLKTTLQKYEGVEDELLAALVKKYGSEPEPKNEIGETLSQSVVGERPGTVEIPTSATLKIIGTGFAELLSGEVSKGQLTGVVREDIAAALGISVNDVEICSIREGSLIVDFKFTRSAPKATSSDELSRLLKSSGYFREGGIAKMHRSVREAELIEVAAVELNENSQPDGKATSSPSNRSASSSPSNSSTSSSTKEDEKATTEAGSEVSKSASFRGRLSSFAGSFAGTEVAARLKAVRSLAGLSNPETFIRRFGPVFQYYRKDREWFLLVEIAFSVACGILESIRPAQNDCIPVSSFAVAGCLLYLAGHVVLRPFRAPIDTVFFVFGGAMAASASIFYLVFHIVGEAVVALETIGTVMVMVWMYLSVVRSATVVYGSFKLYQMQAEEAKRILKLAGGSVAEDPIATKGVPFGIDSRAGSFQGLPHIAASILAPPPPLPKTKKPPLKGRTPESKDALFSEEERDEKTQEKRHWRRKFRAETMRARQAAVRAPNWEEAEWDADGKEPPLGSGSLVEALLPAKLSMRGADTEPDVPDHRRGSEWGLRRLESSRDSARGYNSGYHSTAASTVSRPASLWTSVSSPRRNASPYERQSRVEDEPSIVMKRMLLTMPPAASSQRRKTASPPPVVEPAGNGSSSELDLHEYL